MGMKRIFLKNVNEKNILKAIVRHKAACSLMSPFTLLGLTQNPEFRREDLSSMKLIVVGGSVLSEATLKKIKVIDMKTGEPLKANTPGELCVRSDGLMKCYVGNEEATRESIDKDGWFHTGDVGYYDDSQNIYVIERIKEMIKVRDMQVVPSEIESVIGTLPGVLEVGVAGVLQKDETYRLVALVVKKEGHNITEKDISSHVENTLSDYKKLTGGVFFVKFLPTTGSGKLNRSELKIMAKNFQS